MKLRIRENSIRLRLTKNEVAGLAEHGLIVGKTEFTATQIFYYSLKSTETAENLQANFENGRIEILVPKKTAKQWTETEEVGISGEAGKLKILIEKDFVCLNAREGEDESDAFPHPKEKEIIC